MKKKTPRKAAKYPTLLHGQTRFCAVEGCLADPMSRLPFCPDHLYEHRTCDIAGCLGKLPLTTQPHRTRCRGHHPYEQTKAQVIQERALRLSIPTEFGAYASA